MRNYSRLCPSVAPATVYAIFGTKRALLSALIDEFLEFDAELAGDR